MVRSATRKRRAAGDFITLFSDPSAIRGKCENTSRGAQQERAGFFSLSRSPFLSAVPSSLFFSSAWQPCLDPRCPRAGIPGARVIDNHAGARAQVTCYKLAVTVRGTRTMSSAVTYKPTLPWLVTCPDAGRYNVYVRQICALRSGRGVPRKRRHFFSFKYFFLR